MKRKPSELALVAVSLVCLVVLAACNCAPTLRYITIAPTTAVVAVGTTQTFTATGYYSNGAITPGISASWSSSNTSIATIDPVAGVATGVATGSTTITATALGITSSSATLTVAPLVSIAVTPTPQTIAIGGTQQYDAMGTYNTSSGPGTVDVTSAATWAAANSTIASFSTTTPGLATGLAAGTTNVTATLNGVVGTASLTVTSGTTLVITPASASIGVGNSTTLIAEEQYADMSLHPPVGPVTWSSDTPADANVVSTGAASATVAGFAAGMAKISATEGTLTTTTPAAITVVTGSTHYAFVSNINSGTIQSYTVTADTAPYLTSLATTPLTEPTATFINPNGKYLYELDGNGHIWIYTVTPATGAIAQTTGVTQGQTAGQGGFEYGVVDPYGRFVYIVDDGTGSGAANPNGTIYGFTINQTTGALTPITGVNPFTTNLLNPEDLIIDHTGSFLYATNNNLSGAGTVSAYSIDPTTGALTPLSTPTFNTGDGPWLATLDPTGTYMYVANNTAGTVSSFSLNADGTLTSLGADATVTGASSVYNLAVTPNGMYLYVLDQGSTNGQVYGYALTSGVPATTPITGTPIATGALPYGMAIDPTGVLLAVDNAGDGINPSTISLFTINSDGTLTSQTPVATGVNPNYVTFYNAP